MQAGGQAAAKVIRGVWNSDRCKLHQSCQVGEGVRPCDDIAILHMHVMYMHIQCTCVHTCTHTHHTHAHTYTYHTHANMHTLTHHTHTCYTHHTHIPHPHPHIHPHTPSPMCTGWWPQITLTRTRTTMTSWWRMPSQAWVKMSPCTRSDLTTQRRRNISVRRGAYLLLGRRRGMGRRRRGLNLGRRPPLNRRRWAWLQARHRWQRALSVAWGVVGLLDPVVLGRRRYQQLPLPLAAVLPCHAHWTW